MIQYFAQVTKGCNLAETKQNRTMTHLTLTDKILAIAGTVAILALSAVWLIQLIKFNPVIY